MIAWVYGCQRFLDNISEMFHLPAVLQVYWKIMWMFVSPLVLAAVVILKWVQYKDMVFETGPRDQDKYVYPEAVQVLGWILELSPTVLTLVYPIWVIHR